MHMGKEINLVVKISQDFDQDKKGRNIQRPKDNENENKNKVTTSTHPLDICVGQFADIF